MSTRRVAAGCRGLRCPWWSTTSLLSRETTGLRSAVTPLTPPVTSTACVATPTSSPCSPTTRLAPVHREMCSIIPPVRVIILSTHTHTALSSHSSLFSSSLVPCCPEDVTIALVSTETLEIMWSSVRGAELYETTAEEIDDVIHCKDTAPVCALSDLRCNTQYSVVVTPCSEIRGCNRTCKPHTHETGKTHINTIGNKQCNGVFTLNYIENILF